MAAPRTQFYHPATLIEAALKGIERCIRRAEGASLVVGTPGTGKSLLLAKVADHVRDDFDVALLSGASICTRRALWQAVMAAIGEPYRGIDEADLRIALVERIRGLAATGSGLAILVDEANTLPTRLIEELRLLTNVPTPLPAVHLVLAGTIRLEEMLAAPRMESLSQRIAVRAYLEPLDHTETMAYLQTQTKTAGLSWERLFAAGCDDAVFTVTDGVPRLINQLCDQALVIVAESSRQVTPSDIAAAWREIQRLPAPMGLEPRTHIDDHAPASASDRDDEHASDGFGDDVMETIEFGSGDEDFATLETPAPAERTPNREQSSPPHGDPWNGPDVELVFDQASDPFDSFFREDGTTSQRLVVDGPDNFSSCRPVTSREGQAMGRLLVTLSQLDGGTPPAASNPGIEKPESSRDHRIEEQTSPPLTAAVVAVDTDLDDADMVVIEDDLHDADSKPCSIFSVRPGDYRSLFTRLRRGDRR